MKTNIRKTLRNRKIRPRGEPALRASGPFLPSVIKICIARPRGQAADVYRQSPRTAFPISRESPHLWRFTSRRHPFTYYRKFEGTCRGSKESVSIRARRNIARSCRILAWLMDTHLLKNWKFAPRPDRSLPQEVCAHIYLARYNWFSGRRFRMTYYIIPLAGPHGIAILILPPSNHSNFSASLRTKYNVPSEWDLLGSHLLI